ncbi:DUF2066 domain-containing protein [Thalassospira sp.]|uniref:DUF2066 domain-containing protein n=1 Tax=Thalassospira sp. TaxID=1912094 RepID=UPI002734877D|nr:DUF2066 domain-containing protein [Thalassospira sp.]MDP2696919.1 DUF2066 domain-containing protein [Thalassospira sp.]
MLDRLKKIIPLTGFAMLVVLVAAPVGAQDLFSVAGVRVDESAETAARARDLALANGQRIAFDRVVARLTLPEHRARLGRPGDGDLANLVRDFGVSNERTSSVRYIADMTVRFKDNELRNYLRFRDIPFAETLSKPVVILPVYKSGPTAVLWDDPNPWRDVWSRDGVAGGLVPVKTPIGDLQDIGTVSVEQAQAGTQERFVDIAGRYGADVTVVAVAEVTGASGAETVDVSVSRYGRDGVPQVFGVRETTASGETVSQTLEKAAIAVSERLEDEWKRANLIDYGTGGQLIVFVPITGLDDWAGIERRLNQLPLIRSTKIVAMSRREVQLALDYVGSPDQLRLALAQQNLTLMQMDDLWFLQPVGQNRPGTLSLGG